MLLIINYRLLKDLFSYFDDANLIYHQLQLLNRSLVVVFNNHNSFVVEQLIHMQRLNQPLGMCL